jgi:integration host factor subunit alpha
LGAEKITLTKADLVEAVYDSGGFTKRESTELVGLVFDAVKESLGSGRKVKISGFGNFEVRDKPPRPGRNPRTGEVIMIEGRRILKFKPSQVLLARVNPPGGSEA